MTKRQKVFSALGRFFKDLFTKNIGLKIVALLFAVLLWGYVLAIENPAYVKRVRDVDITITGEDSLNNRGLMLVTRDTGTTDVDILCKINKHSELDASRVTCSVDLSALPFSFDPDEDSKTVTVEVQAKVASEYGTIQSLSVSSVDLTLARISSRSNIQVEVNTEGALADGFVCELPDSLTVSLRGQKSEVDRISYANTTVDLSSFAVNDPEMLAGTYDLVLPVQFYDSANVRIDDIVTSNGEKVTTNVRVVIRAYKDVPIVPNVITDKQFDASYAYSCVALQESIRLYGSLSVLNSIDAITTESIIPSMKQTDERMTVGLLIPANVETLASQSRTVGVYLRVWELEADPVEYEIPIAYSETKPTVALSGEEPKTVRVSVSGSVLAMASFDPGTFTATVDLGNYGDGTYTLPVVLRFSGDARTYSFSLLDDTVTVVLTLIQVEEIEE